MKIRMPRKNDRLRFWETDARDVNLRKQVTGTVEKRVGQTLYDMIDGRERTQITKTREMEILPNNPASSNINHTHHQELEMRLQKMVMCVGEENKLSKIEIAQINTAYANCLMILGDAHNTVAMAKHLFKND